VPLKDALAEADTTPEQEIEDTGSSSVVSVDSTQQDVLAKDETTQELEVAGSARPSVGFLDLPFELREMVYFYAFPRPIHRWELLCSCCRCDRKDFRIKGWSGRHLWKTAVNERPLLLVSRQLYAETRKYYYTAQRASSFEDDFSFRRTKAWILAAGREMLEVMEGMRVSIRTRRQRVRGAGSQEWVDTDYISPIEWLKFQEEYLPPGFKGLFQVQPSSVGYIWELSYNIGKSCRDVGMSWDITTHCVRQVEALFQSPMVIARFENIASLSGILTYNPMAGVWEKLWKDVVKLVIVLIKNGMTVEMVEYCVNDIQYKLTYGVPQAAIDAEGSSARVLVRPDTGWYW